MEIKASIVGWVLSCLFTPVVVMPAMAQDKSQPPVRVNVLNVCTPGQAETGELAAALETVPLKPDFAGDYEVARGRSTLQGPTVSRWVRLRYEFPGKSVFGSAQYSFSLEKSGITETLVLLMREPKKIVSVSIEDTVTAGSPAAVLASDTPAGRVRVERFGKGSLVLERCPQANQAAYNDLFQRASDLMRTYRSALGVRKVVTGELEKLQATSASQQPSHPAR